MFWYSFLWIDLYLEEVFLSPQIKSRVELYCSAFSFAVVTYTFNPKVHLNWFLKGLSISTMLMYNFKVKTRRKSFVLNFNIHLNGELMTLKTSIMQREIGKVSLHMSINALLYDCGRNLSQKYCYRDKNLHHPFILVSKTISINHNLWQCLYGESTCLHVNYLRIITNITE